jgi:glyoxylase-like metal-dependent hydrolase (beta-lactamase superfamily II)
MAGAYPKELWSVMTHGGRYPDAALGPGEEAVVRVGSETARVRNMGRAHTSDDVAVYLEKRRVLITGDMVFHCAHPVLFAQSGCSTASWTALLDSLGRYEIRVLVPGHGQVSDRSALIALKEYFTSIRSAVDDPERLAALREKNKKLHAVPGMSGFARTVRFIREENLRSQP